MPSMFANEPWGCAGWFLRTSRTPAHATPSELSWQKIPLAPGDKARSRMEVQHRYHDQDLDTAAN